MPYVGLAFFVALGVVLANADKIRYWWSKGCDACRLQHIGGAVWTHTPHTCSRGRSVYKDRSGQVWEFGKKVASK